MQKRTGSSLMRRGVLAVTLALLASTTALSSPSAAETDEKSESRELVDEISVIEDQVDIRESREGFEAVNENGEVQIPSDSSRSIVMSNISIKLPGNRQRGQLDGDEVVYADALRDTDIVVRATDIGSQTTMVQNSPKSPDRFVFEVDLPKKGSLKMNPDGSVSVWGTETLQEAGAKETTHEAEVGFFDIPWAIDANGNTVETHYKISGENQLVQCVSHSNSGEIAYPIVADPSYKDYCGWVGCSRYVARTKTKSLYDDRFSSTWSGWAAIYGGLCAGAALLTGTGGLVCGAIAGWLVNDLVANLEYAGQNNRCIVAQYDRQIGIVSTYNWTTASASHSRCHYRTY